MYQDREQADTELANAENPARKALDRAVAANDVRALVPGDPQAYFTLADELDKAIGVLAEGKSPLARVDVHSWRGQAAEAGRGDMRTVDSGYGLDIRVLGRVRDAFRTNAHALAAAKTAGREAMAGLAGARGQASAVEKRAEESRGKIDERARRDIQQQESTAYATAERAQNIANKATAELNATERELEAQWALIAPDARPAPGPPRPGQAPAPARPGPGASASPATPPTANHPDPPSYRHESPPATPAPAPTPPNNNVPNPTTTGPGPVVVNGVNPPPRPPAPGDGWSPGPNHPPGLPAPTRPPSDGWRPMPNPAGPGQPPTPTRSAPPPPDGPPPPPAAGHPQPPLDPNHKPDFGEPTPVHPGPGAHPSTPGVERTPGGGFDLGAGGFFGLLLVAALVVGYGVYRVRHFRANGLRVRFPSIPIGGRLTKALGAHKAATGDPDQPIQLTQGARDPNMWAPLHLSKRGYPAAEKGSHTLPVDPTTTSGLGLVGPQASAVMRAMALTVTIHHPDPDTPTGDIVVPVEDARVLFGTAPDPAPPGLYVVETLQDALTLLEQRIQQRAKQPDTADQQPLTMLVLAQQPDGHTAAHLAALLERGGPLGVTALILGHWEPATLYINGEIVTTSTGNPNLRYLHGARLNNVPRATATQAWTLLAHQQIPDPEPPDTEPAESAEFAEHDAADAHAEPDSAAASPDREDGDRPETEPSTCADAPDGASSPPLPPGEAPNSPAETPAEPDATTVACEPARARPRTPGEADPAPATDPAELDTDTEPFGADRSGLYLGILGPVTLTQDGASITLPDTPAQLLTLLALEHPTARRAAINAALWPDAGGDSNALNTLISRGIRRNLRNATHGASEQLIVITPGKCGLNPNRINVDYWDLQTALALPPTTDPAERANAYLKALAHYSGELAPDIYQDWITPYREHTQHAIIETAHTLAEELAAQDDHRKALAVLEKARRCDPHHEDTYYQMIDIHTGLGQQSQANQKYRQLKAKLGELGLKPTRPAPR